MAGADVFAMDPDEVHKAVEVLFDVEAEVADQTETVVNEATEVAGSFKDSNSALGSALEEAAEW